MFFPQCPLFPLSFRYTARRRNDTVHSAIATTWDRETQRVLGHYEPRTRVLPFLRSSNALEIQVVAEEDNEMGVTRACPTPRLSIGTGYQNQLGALGNTHPLISFQAILIWLDGKRGWVILRSFPHDLDRPCSTHKSKTWKELAGVVGRELHPHSSAISLINGLC